MSLSRKSKIALLFLILVIGTVFYINNQIYKPHTSIDEMETIFSGTSISFLEKIKEDVSVWENKVVELKGEVTNIEDKGITISDNIYCQFKDSTVVKALKTGDKISIKGRVVGYDDLLEELRIDKTIIINN